MSPRYSRYKSKFYIDPDHEKQANSFVNSLGSQYVLEGALNIGNGDLRVWHQNTRTNAYNATVIPIVVNFDESINAPVLIPESKIKEPELEQDLATDEQFLIEKK